MPRGRHTAAQGALWPVPPSLPTCAAPCRTATRPPCTCADMMSPCPIPADHAPPLAPRCVAGNRPPCVQVHLPPHFPWPALVHGASPPPRKSTARPAPLPSPPAPRHWSLGNLHAACRPSYAAMSPLPAAVSMPPPSTDCVLYLVFAGHCPCPRRIDAYVTAGPWHRTPVRRHGRCIPCPSRPACPMGVPRPLPVPILPVP